MIIAANTIDRNPTIESFIEGFGVKDWVFEVVDLDAIDNTLSDRNQARMEPVIPELVERYTKAAATGAKFPPLLLGTSAGRMFVLDGNNRRAAMLAAGITRWNAYIVETSSATTALMARTANTHNGAPLSDAEQRVLLLDLHSKGSFTRPQVAALAGTTVGIATKIIKAEEARARATSRRHADKVSDATLVDLLTVQPQEAFDLMIAAVATGAIMSGQARGIAGKARKIETDAERIGFILDATKATVGAPTKGNIASDMVKLTRSMGSILAVNPTTLAMVATNEEREGLLKKIEACVVQFGKIMDAF